MRPSQITKLERDVQDILRVLVEIYINSFGLEVENEYLVCLSSGEPVSDEIVDSILSLPRQGRILLLKSVSNWEPCHLKILLKRIVFFNRCFNSVFSMMHFQDKEVPKKTSSVEVNRAILAHLIYNSNYSSRNIGFEKALEYPLTPVPLNLSNVDGSMRKNKPIECRWKYAQNI